MLEKLLCSNEEPSAAPLSQSTKTTCQDIPDVDEFVHNFYTDYPNCKDFIVDFYTITKNTGSNMDETANDAVEILDEESGRFEYFIERKLQPEREKRSREKKSQREEETRKSSSCNGGHSRVGGGGVGGEVEADSSSIDNPSRNISAASNGEQENELERREHNFGLNNAETFANLHTALSIQDSMRERAIEASATIEQSQGTRSDQSIIQDFTNPDISQILGTQTDSIEIPQTQYLLNQVSHENNVTGETIHVENSLPDVDSQKLISEANKTLSNLLLEGECQNHEISEQTDSGICTVISSENTSLYDKSPEEKKTFANELENGESQRLLRDDDAHENTSYSCSNFASPKRTNSTIHESSSCVCSSRATRNITSVESHMEVSLSENSCGDEVSKNSAIISSSFNGTNEEIVGIAYGNGQISVCDSNPSNFQINYSENWESLNLNIDATRSDNSKREFWGEFKCQNCPSTSQREITKIGNNIERYAQERIAARRGKDGKAKKRHQRKFERRNGKKSHEDPSRSSFSSCNVRAASGLRLPTASSESSRSNSTDRCLNPRLVNFGASLHPSQNTRQMPNFGSHSPQPSPRLCHFEPRAETSANSSRATGSRGQSSKSLSHNRKLLDHRRSRSEQIARMKKNHIATDATRHEESRGELAPDGKSAGRRSSPKDNSLMNDGLGPRTDKSGLATDSPSPPPILDNSRCTLRPHSRDNHQQPRRIHKTVTLANSTRSGGPNLELSLTRRAAANVPSSSSCSSCCDSSSETSEFQSDCQDDEEIALAMQAAEIANRNQIRAKFR